MERLFSNILKKGGKITALIELGRPWNGILSGLLALLGTVLNGGSLSFASGLLTLMFIISYMGGTILNDVYDEFIDKLNMPFRPLQEKRISKKEAWLFSITMHILAILISLMLSINVFILLIIFLILSLFYSAPPIQFSRRNIISQLELSFTFVFIPIYTGVVYSTKNYIPNLSFFLFLISIYMFFFFILLLKDFKDIKGDMAGGKKTAVILLGAKNTQILSIIGTLMTFITTVILFSGFYKFNQISLFFPSIFFIMILYSEINIIKKPELGFGIARISGLFLIVYFLFLLIFF